jgi:hypothetical protein
MRVKQPDGTVKICGSSELLTTTLGVTCTVGLHRRMVKMSGGTSVKYRMQTEG